MTYSAVSALYNMSLPGASHPVGNVTVAELQRLLNTPVEHSKVTIVVYDKLGQGKVMIVMCNEVDQSKVTTVVCNTLGQNNVIIIVSDKLGQG